MDFQRPTREALALQALQANQAHQYALAQHAEKLTAELAELDKLLAQADVEDGDEDLECDFYIPNAKPPVGPIRSFGNPESPFFQDATKRNRYLSFTVRHSMPPKEVEALKAAVNAELRRVEQLEGASSTTTDTQMANKLDWTVIAEKVSDSSSITRTAEECKIKWIGDLSPAINRGPWTPAELQNLENIVKKRPSKTDINWVDVARELGTNRLPLDCMRHNIERPRHVWNEESDRRLLEAVRQYGTTWSLVAKYVSPNLTANQCSTRYLRTLDPTLRRRAWTLEEDKRLVSAVAGYGRAAWTEVANTIPGRSNEQCRERWVNFLDPARIGTKQDKEWDEEQDAALIEAVNVHGKKWKAIGVQLDRSANSCRLRYEALEPPVAGPSRLSETPLEDHETETPSGSARSTPKPRAKKTQPQAATVPSTAAKPARPRPRPLAKNRTGAAASDTDDSAAEEPPRKGEETRCFRCRNLKKTRNILN
ncbi:Myb domain protein 4r1 [Mycena sanguinolenta]|uniref:Myb domain protein 4r1 n=1 Tax=Mycena sanguinolenta TaxID=230812 RepID=A0A8H6Y9W1_9AGAR|nr:Myb domain protein 4r1 [Mycena sanguinolenta]